MQIFGYDLSEISTTTWIVVVIVLLFLVGMLGYKYWFPEGIWGSDDDDDSPCTKKKSKKSEEELDEIIDEMNACQKRNKRRK